MHQTLRSLLACAPLARALPAWALLPAALLLGSGCPPESVDDDDSADDIGGDDDSAGEDPARAYDCASACWGRDHEDAWCVDSAACESWCEERVDTWTRDQQAAFTSCALLQPLCHSTFEDCLESRDGVWPWVLHLSPLEWSDESGDGVWRAGERVFLQTRLGNDGVLPYLWYPGATLRVGHPDVRAEWTERTLFSLPEGARFELPFRVVSDPAIETPAQVELVVEFGVALTCEEVPGDCPDVAPVRLTLTVE